MGYFSFHGVSERGGVSGFKHVESIEECYTSLRKLHPRMTQWYIEEEDRPLSDMRVLHSDENEVMVI